jgi:hypothetical protein
MGIRAATLLLVCVGMLACTGSGRRADGGSGSNVITVEQMAQYPGANAYEIVQRIRPRFLQRRGQTSISNQESPYPLVYMDGMRRGTIDELRQIPSLILDSIEYISPADATTRWGTGHTAGVILLTSRHR